MKPEIPFQITKRPGGDYAVQRFIPGQGIKRHGVYPTIERARAAQRIANSPDPDLQRAA